jgi:hypothetical protein
MQIAWDCRTGSIRSMRETCARVRSSMSHCR